MLEKVLKLPEATGNRSGVTGIGKLLKFYVLGIHLLVV